MSTSPLHARPDRLRDLIERLLALFLADPLADNPSPAQSPAPRTLAPAPPHPTARTRRVFDLPSGALIVWTLAPFALLAQALPALRRGQAPMPVAEAA